MQKTLIAVPVGNNIKMDCTAIGNPKPTILWYINGKVFKERRGYPLKRDPYRHAMIIKDSVPDDSGKYTCNVSNRYGWINYTYRVDVQGKPSLFRIPIVLHVSRFFFSHLSHISYNVC